MTTVRCRVCGHAVREFFDFGRQPLSDAFLPPGDHDSRAEYFFRLAVGICESCTMVQLMEEVPREEMFHADYPYLSSGSQVMAEHFGKFAARLRAGELARPDPFVVELGCNDGIMLRSLAEAGIRHLGVEPSGGVAALAEAKGIRVCNEFFEEELAARIRAENGPADVIYAANTLCHIPYVDSILSGVRHLLAPGGVFVFEDPYFAEIVERTSFDQIYDEHFYFFTAKSVQAMARLHDLELVDVERLAVHGGEVRYTLAHKGMRRPTPAVAEMLDAEARQRLTEPETLHGFAAKVRQNCSDLVELLTNLRSQGKRVVGYGATAKSATVLNYCGIGPDLVPFISDISPTKQGRLTPGSRIPVRGLADFADPYPDYALLLAWNHAEEIMAKEQEFRSTGGRWIRYVPTVHLT